MFKKDKKLQSNNSIPLVDDYTEVNMHSGRELDSEDQEMISELEKSLEHTVDQVLSEVKKEPTVTIKKEFGLEESGSKVMNQEKDRKSENQPLKNEPLLNQEKLDSDVASATLDSSKNRSNQPISLALSSHLKIAESKIQELNQRYNALHVEKQKLSVEVKSLRANTERMSNENKILKSNHQEKQFHWEEKNNILESALEDQKIEFKNLQERNKILEDHISKDLKNVQLRERELENKLSIKQNEIYAVVREKDQNILRLQREVDRLQDKMEDQENKVERITKEKKEAEEKSFRVIRTLQMSISLLKGGIEKNWNSNKDESVVLSTASSDQSVMQKSSQVKEADESMNENEDDQGQRSA